MDRFPADLFAAAESGADLLGLWAAIARGLCLPDRHRAGRLHIEASAARERANSAAYRASTAQCNGAQDAAGALRAGRDAGRAAYLAVQAAHLPEIVAGLKCLPMGDIEPPTAPWMQVAEALTAPG